MIDLVIYGAGSYGSTVAELAQTLGHRVIGYVDDAAVRQKDGIPVWPKDGIPAHSRPWALALGLGQTPARRRAVSWADDNSVQLATLIHPSADMSKTAAIGRGCIVHSGTVIWSNSVVGECTFVSPGSPISHDARVGSYCHLAMGSRIGSAVTMESDVQVGISATIMTGVRTVGRGCVIGAGAVVIRDVAQHTTVAGVPARVIASPE